MIAPRILFSRAAVFASHGLLIAVSGFAKTPKPIADPTIRGELTGTEWAGESMLGSPVAISLDNQGRVYITQTVRRKESDLDIRAHTAWVPTELSFESVDDKRNFYHKELAASRSDANKKWLKDRNGDGISDWHDLTVQRDLVLRLEDKSERGVADTRAIFAEIPATEVTGIAAGVLWFDGSVYVTCIPSLWKLADTKGTGQADEKKEIVTGFGVHVAYAGHDMHGLTVGPDGRIYWSIGDKGVNVTTPDGRHVKYAHQGCVMRCEPDGSNFEVFAHGLRNPQELAFDEFGNLFNVDNDGDLPTERERFVYITEQSDSGWRCNWQYRKGDYNPWMAEQLFVPRWQGQAAYITPPLANYSDGPCGFKYNPGTALNEKYRRHFFLTQFPGRKLTAFRVEPVGAYFKMVGEHLAFGGPMMTGINWGPDGALYVADWNNAKWEPHDKGKVWKLDAPGAANNPLRAETRKLLADGMGHRGTHELVELLGHADQRIRLGAQFELVKRGDEKSLLDAALTKERRSSTAEESPKAPALGQLARIHAIWGIGEFGRKQADAVAPLVPLLSDRDPEIRAQATKVIGDARYKPAADAVTKLLADASPRVQFHAGITLAKIGDTSAFDAVVAMLEKNNDEDAYLRHAGVTALTGICASDAGPIAKLASHKSPAVRLAAVVALRRLSNAGVADFLKDSDKLVVAEAARAIHDDYSIPDALPALAAMLDQGGATLLSPAPGDRSVAAPVADPVVLRRAINANLRIGGEPAARRVAAYAANASAPETVRVEALLSLSTWTKPEVLDRVEGRCRPLDPHPAAEAHAALDATATALLAEKSSMVRKAAIDAIAKLGYAKATPELMATLVDSEQPSELRRAALAALAALKDPKLDEAIKLALDTNDPSLHAVAESLLVSGGQSAERAIPVLTKALEHGTQTEQQSALEALGKMKAKESSELIEAWLDKLNAGEVPPALQLDVIDAARADGSPRVKTKLKKYEKLRPADDPLAAWREALAGGDAAAGKKIALEHIEAQCIRCHKIGGEGAEVGPDLSHVASRLPRPKLLESLIEPNAEIAEGFGVVVITLKNGESASGSIAGETATQIKLRQLDGAITMVDKKQVAEQTKPVSMMLPMGNVLTPREVRDVIEFLSTLK
jgi:quinoprotein glucose dehydrogenase